MTRRGVSFVVHSYNEATALGRLIESSLCFSELFSEWVVLDHRSNDDTQAVLDGLEPKLAKKAIRLVRLFEARDLSAECTFADVRNQAWRGATHPVAVLHDADFILGRCFLVLLQRAIGAITARGSNYYGGAFTVPVVWDKLHTDPVGRIRKHGRVWVHSIRPRIMIRDAVHWEQIGHQGLVEDLVVDDAQRPEVLKLTPDRFSGLVPHTLVSVNVKPAERIAMRRTMTTFMQDAMCGRVTGTWLENIAAGKVRNQKPYKYQNWNLIGWRLNVPNLRLPR